MPERFAVLVSVVVFVLFALVLPVVRLWRQTRVFGVVLHRGLATGMSAWIVALLAWGVAVAALEPSRLGIVVSPAGVRLGGWGLIGAGLVVLMLAQAQMGASWRIGIDARPTPLVTHGLYAVVRNPIYTSMSLMLLGLVAVTPSVAMLVAWAITTSVAAVQTRREERHLLSLHGEAYRRYAERVGRFVPGVGRLG